MKRFFLFILFLGLPVAAQARTNYLSSQEPSRYLANPAENPQPTDAALHGATTLAETLTQTIALVEPAGPLDDKTIRQEWLMLCGKLAQSWASSDKQKAKRLNAFCQTLEVQQTPAYASLTLKRNPDGHYIRDPQTGDPKAVFGVGRGYSQALLALRSRLSAEDQKRINLQLESQIVKEFNGWMHTVRYPEAGPSERFLLLKLVQALKSHQMANGGYSLTLTDLKGTPLAELLKTYAAVTARGEAAGYVAQHQFLRENHLQAPQFLDLSKKSAPSDQSVSTLFRLEAEDMKKFPASENAAYKKASINHILNTLYLYRQGTIAVRNQAVVFSLTNQVELAEGRLSPADFQNLARVSPGQASYPDTYFNYLTQPAYYRPSLQELRNKFGP